MCGCGRSGPTMLPRGRVGHAGYRPSFPTNGVFSTRSAMARPSGSRPTRAAQHGGSPRWCARCGTPQPQLAAVQRSSSKFRTRAPLALRLAPNGRRTGPRRDSTSAVEEPRAEAPQCLDGKSGRVSDLAMDLHVVIVITIGVGHLELPSQTQRERLTTVERVGPVLEQKAITIGRSETSNSHRQKRRNACQTFSASRPASAACSVPHSPSSSPTASSADGLRDIPSLIAVAQPMQWERSRTD